MGFKWISEEMGVASLAGTWLAGENRGEGTWGVGAGLIRRGPSGEALEGGLDRGEVVEGMETVGAAAKFSGGLWTAEHEEAEDGGLVAMAGVGVAQERFPGRGGFRLPVHADERVQGQWAASVRSWSAARLGTREQGASGGGNGAGNAA